MRGFKMTDTYKKVDAMCNYCPYCDDLNKKDHGKSFSRTNYDEIYLLENNGHYYVYISVDLKDRTNDKVNRFVEIFSKEISYCPMCGRKLGGLACSARKTQDT